MAFDYKKEYKEFYMPKKTPEIVAIPKMNYLAVRGSGDPNQENSEYKKSISQLYSIAYTLKMSKKTNHQIDGYFDYVVPPLEGFWIQQNNPGEIDFSRKDQFQFISCIRLPDFITEKDFHWAIEEATKKKEHDFSNVEFYSVEEGLCVQCMHIGSYDAEPNTLEAMHQWIEKEGYIPDLNEVRLHHEIYLSDPRKCTVDRLKTVLRHPIKKAGSQDE